jgi:sugar phosphate isomerase/epimerase
MKIYIKNMVSQGTRSYVLRELERLGFKYNTFGSGEIDFVEDLSSAEIKELDHSLQKYGLEMTFRQD